MRIALLAFFTASAMALSPASAVTISNGVVLFSQADAVNGNVTPGDAPGFPVTLSVSGVYRLAGNLAPTSGSEGILVTAPEVTIDMFGFRIAGATAALNGIHGTQREMRIKDGTIRGFTNDAILSEGESLVVEDMHLVDNGQNAVPNGGYAIEDKSGGGARILDNEIRRNLYGMKCSGRCHIQGNSFLDHLYGAIYVVGGATVLGNTIQHNGSYPIYGFDTLLIGYGDNTITENGHPVTANAAVMSPNACDRTPC